MYERIWGDIRLNINNKANYCLAGVLTFIIAKLVLGYVGIENVPLPIFITLLVISYIMVLIGIHNKRLTGMKKRYYVVCAILLANLYITVTIMVIFIQYFSERTMQYRLLLLILLILGILSLCGIAVIGLIIRKQYHD